MSGDGIRIAERLTETRKNVIASKGTYKVLKICKYKQLTHNYNCENRRILISIDQLQNNKKAVSTRVSRAVPHLSTNRALSRLTSEFGWDPVCLA